MLVVDSNAGIFLKSLTMTVLQERTSTTATMSMVFLSTMQTCSEHLLQKGSAQATKSLPKIYSFLHVHTHLLIYFLI